MYATDAGYAQRPKTESETFTPLTEAEEKKKQPTINNKPFLQR